MSIPRVALPLSVVRRQHGSMCQTKMRITASSKPSRAAKERVVRSTTTCAQYGGIDSAARYWPSLQNCGLQLERAVDLNRSASWSELLVPHCCTAIAAEKRRGRVPIFGRSDIEGSHSEWFRLPFADWKDRSRTYGSFPLASVVLLLCL